MSEKEYLKLVSRIGKLLKEKSKIKIYNLSGSGYQDYFTTREIEKLEAKNNKGNRKIAEIDGMIRELLGILEGNGYSAEEVLAQFDSEYTRDILPAKEEAKGRGTL